jgi:hypothetical protein
MANPFGANPAHAHIEDVLFNLNDASDAGREVVNEAWG